MFELAEIEKYESAARCRDAINALERLKQKQSVVSSPDSNFDVFGLFADEVSACISAMYVRGGTVNDKNDFLFNADVSQHILSAECLCAKSLQSCLTLFNALDCNPPASSVQGILQAKMLEWVTMFSSRKIFPTQGWNLHLFTPPSLAGEFFTTSTTWESLCVSAVAAK